LTALPANGHRAQVKIGMASPPASQAATKVCPYLGIALGCGADVMDVGKPGTPGRDHPQRGIARLCFFHTDLQCAAVDGLIDFDHDPARFGRRRAALPADHRDGAMGPGHQGVGRRTDPAHGEVFQSD
jgi:hypothetical protein